MTFKTYFDIRPNNCQNTISMPNSKFGLSSNVKVEFLMSNYDALFGLSLNVKIEFECQNAIFGFSSNVKT